MIEGDRAVVLEWISKGMLSTSQKIRYPSVSVLEIDNDQIHRFRIYDDSAAFLPQGAKHR